MESSKNGVATTRGTRGLLSALAAAIGSAWTTRDKKREAHPIRLISWAGRAQTDSWFLYQLEQSKSRGLYYYSHNQAK